MNAHHKQMIRDRKRSSNNSPIEMKKKKLQQQNFSITYFEMK